MCDVKECLVVFEQITHWAGKATADSEMSLRGTKLEDKVPKKEFLVESGALEDEVPKKVVPVEGKRVVRVPVEAGALGDEVPVEAGALGDEVPKEKLLFSILGLLT